MTSKQRQMSLNQGQVVNYTKKVTEFLGQHPEVTIDHIGGFDESQVKINDAIAAGKCLMPQTNDMMYTSVPAERDPHTTMLFGYVGTWITPVLLVFKGKELNAAWMELEYSWGAA